MPSKKFEVSYKLAIGDKTTVTGETEITAEHAEDCKKRVPGFLCKKYGFEREELPDWECTVKQI